MTTRQLTIEGNRARRDLRSLIYAFIGGLPDRGRVAELVPTLELARLHRSALTDSRSPRCHSMDRPQTGVIEKLTGSADRDTLS